MAFNFDPKQNAAVPPKKKKGPPKPPASMQGLQMAMGDKGAC